MLSQNEILTNISNCDIIDLKFRQKGVNMKINKRQKFVILAVTSLFVGLLVYVIFRPNTYVSKLIFSIINIPFEYANISGCRVVRFYIGDYLWALSLSCWLHVIFLPRRRGSAVCTVAVCVVGLGYELLQFFGVVSGTGDIIDFLMYLLAGLTVNILNIQRR